MQYYLRTIKFDFIPMKYTYGREGSILILLLQLRTQYLREHQLYAIFITYVRENLILLIRVYVFTYGRGRILFLLLRVGYNSRAHPLYAILLTY